MALEPAVVDDMIASYEAIRKGRGKDLEFCVYPARSAADPPWLVVDRSATVRARLVAVRKQLAELGYVRGRGVCGRVEIVDKRVVFLVEEDAEDLQALVRRRWAPRLANEEDPSIAKLGMLLKRAVATTEARYAAEGVVVPDDEAEEGGVAGLSSDELTAILGSDAPEAERAARAFETLSKHLDGLGSGSEERARTGELLEAVRGVSAGELATLIPGFLKVATGELPRDATPLGPGDVVATADLMAGVAAAMGAYLRALVAWERLLDRAASLHDAVDELEASARLEPQPGVVLQLDELLDEYNRARLSSAHAEERAERLREALDEALAALRAGGTA